MKKQTSSVLETDQGELAKFLNSICLFGRSNNEYLIEMLAKHFPDTFEEFGRYVADEEVEEFNENDLNEDFAEQKRTLDRMMYRIVISSINICRKESFSKWAQRDSYAGWKICRLIDELYELAEHLAEPLFGSEYLPGAYLIRNVEFANDHDIDFAETRMQFDFEDFENIASWLNFMVRKKSKYELPSFNIDAICKDICDGKKKFNDVVKGLQIENPSPSKLKKILGSEGKMRTVLNAVITQQDRNVTNIASELGVGRDTVRRWANEYKIDLGSNSQDDDS